MENKSPPTSPPSAGIEDSNSGKPICNSKNHSRHTKDTFQPSPCHPTKEDMLPQEEETKNSSSGTSLTCLTQPEYSMPRHKLIKSPSTLYSNGLPLPPSPESKSGTFNLLVITLPTLSCLTLSPTLKFNNLNVKKKIGIIKK